MPVYEGPYDYLYFGDGQTERKRLAVDFDPITRGVRQHAPAKDNKRSRGRHQPGSGDYWNRWALGGYTEFVPDSGNTRYCLCADHTLDPATPSGYWKKGAKQHVYWDGYRCFTVTVGVSNWIGPSGGQWIVEGSIHLRDHYGYSTSWNQLLDRYGKAYSTPRYSFGDQDDPDARSRAMDYFEHLDSRFLSMQLFEFDRDFQQYAGWSINGKFVDHIPRFTDRLDSFITRLEEKDDSLTSVHVACANAFVDCVNKLPQIMEQNRAADILDVLQLLASFKEGFVLEHGLRDLAGSAWLGYRYAYGTTRSDIEEAVNLMARLETLLSVTTFKVHGFAKTRDGAAVKCVIRVSTDEFNAFLPKIKRYGAQLNAYALWDLVPYSFIADWFVDIGGWLEFAEKQKIAYRIPPRDMWFSIEQKFKNEYGFDEVYYHRFQWDVQSSMASYISRDARTTTIVKRAIDVLAMFA